MCSWCCLYSGIYRADVFIYSKYPGCLLPILSCVYLVLYSQNVCVCGCLCMCVCVCARACVCARVYTYALRIVSRDKILRFKNTLIIIIIIITLYKQFHTKSSAENWTRRKLSLPKKAPRPHPGHSVGIRWTFCCPCPSTTPHHYIYIYDCSHFWQQK